MLPILYYSLNTVLMFAMLLLFRSLQLDIRRRCTATKESRSGDKHDIQTGERPGGDFPRISQVFGQPYVSILISSFLNIYETICKTGNTYKTHYIYFFISADMSLPNISITFLSTFCRGGGGGVK